MKLAKKFLSIFLGSIMLFSTVACQDDTAAKHRCESICTTCGKCTDEICPEDVCKVKCDCEDEYIEESPSETTKVEYESINETFVKNGVTDYTLIISADASSTIYGAVKEFNLFISKATGAEFSVATDDNVSYSENAKFVSIGETTIATNAGFTVPKTLNTSGYAIKTIGKSIFIGGRTEQATIFGVYEFLERTIGFEVYGYDEIVVVETDEMKTPKFDFTDEPDIEYRTQNLGYLGVANADNPSSTIGQRFRYASVNQMYPLQGEHIGPYHNSFTYLPVEDPEVAEKQDIWYATGKENLCYTARGIPEEYDRMTSKVAEVMISLFDLFPEGTHIYFTHSDNPYNCGCDACKADSDKYGTASASVIKFTNTVIEKVEAWKEKSEKHKHRDITYIIFAYTFTIVPPVKEENGTYVPIDADVTPNEHLAVLYAPILTDFIHDKYHHSNADALKVQQQWGAICPGRLMLWYYGAYFWDYFVPYNNFDSMQGNFKAAKETGTMYMYNQSPYDTPQGTGFLRFKGYLESNLLWDVNADVEELTNKFFKNYYKQAANAVRKYYDSMRIHYAYLAEYKNVGGWIGTRIDQPQYFPVNTLLEWVGYFDEAYLAIEPLKLANPELYELLYERICLESLAPRYLLLLLYGEQVYTPSQLTQARLSFKADCGKLDITMKQEHESVSLLWASWNV